MRTRRFLGVTGVAALAMILAGCSSASTESPESPAAGTTEISVWHYWDGANADQFDAMVDQFNNEHENVHVVTSNVPNSDFLTKLKTSATSNTLPDVAIGDLIWVPQIAQMGNLADLSTVVSKAVIEDVNPALREYGNIDGKQLSVPVSANNLAYMYNRDVFKEAGLDPDNPPTTWEELLEQGKTIVETTGKSGYDLFTEAGDNGEGLTWNFQVSLWQAGGEFLNDDNSAAAFNTPEGIKATQFWIDLIDSGVSKYASWGEFEKGNGGSAQEGSWMVGIWAPDPPFDFDVAPLPNPQGSEPVTNLGGEQAMVFNNSDENVKAAGEFLEWFLQPEHVASWSEATGMIPVLQSVAEGAEYREWVEENEPRLLPYVDQMQFAKTRPNTPLYSKISYAFAKEMERAFAGEVSADEALNNAETAVNEVIANQ